MTLRANAGLSLVEGFPSHSTLLVPISDGVRSDEHQRVYGLLLGKHDGATLLPPRVC